jgi:hypothetical protein
MWDIIGIPVLVAMSFLMFFYCLYYMAHLMDWSVRTLSGNKHRIIVEVK